MSRYIRKKNRLCPKWLVCEHRKVCGHARPHRMGRFSISCASGWICLGGDTNPAIEAVNGRYGAVVFPRKPECIDLNNRGGDTS